MARLKWPGLNADFAFESNGGPPLKYEKQIAHRPSPQPPILFSGSRGGMDELDGNRCKKASLTLTSFWTNFYDK